MLFRWIVLIALAALFAGCSATVPVRPYMFIQNDREANPPHAVVVEIEEESA